MKPWFFTSVVIFATFFLNCNTDPLKNAIDDFSIVVELQEIHTGIGLAFYDKSTGDLITQDITIEFEESATEHTIDIFSDPLEEETFTGGFMNVGIRNESMENMEEEIFINARISSNGYIPQDINVMVVDTGFVSHTFDLYPESDPPANYISSELSAPRDENGNPTQFPFLLPDTSDTSQSNALFKTLASLNDDELKTVMPFYFIKRGNEAGFKNPTAQDIRFVFSDGTSFTGLPSDYRINAKVWSTNGEEIQGLFINLFVPPWGYRRLSFLSAFSISDFQVKQQSNGSFKSISRIEPTRAQDTLIVSLVSLSSGYEVAKTLLEDYKKHTDVENNISWNMFPDFNYQDVPTEIKHYAPISLLFAQNLQDAIENPIIFSTDKFEANGFDMSRAITYVYSNPSRSPNFTPRYPFTQYRGGSISVAPIFQISGYGSSEGTLWGSGYASGTARVGNLSVPFSDNMDTNALDPSQGDQQYFLPKTHVYVEFSTPDGPNPPVRIDAYNGAGTDYNRTFNLQAVPKQSGTIDTDLTVNISCKDPNKGVRVNSIPQGAASIRFRESGTTGRFKETAFINWNYTNREIKGASVQLRRVLVGTTYDLNITFMGTTEPSQITITGTSMSQDVTAPDTFCTE